MAENILRQEGHRLHVSDLATRTGKNDEGGSCPLRLSESGSSLPFGCVGRRPQSSFPSFTNRKYESPPCRSSWDALSLKPSVSRSKMFLAHLAPNDVGAAGDVGNWAIPVTASPLLGPVG